MNEEALEIFQYLPIRKSKVEEDYITHLWNTFLALDYSNDTARPFLMMPFHLLFMLALQYKVLRISKERKGDYGVAFTLNIGRNHDALSEPQYVFDMALLNERSLPDLLKLVDMSKGDINGIKALIDNRNSNLAHANGGIEQDPDGKINQYLASLNTLQTHLLPLNDIIAENWNSEFSDEDDPVEFLETRLLNSYLCPADFNKGKLLKYRIDEIV